MALPLGALNILLARRLTVALVATALLALANQYSYAQNQQAQPANALSVAKAEHVKWPVSGMVVTTHPLYLIAEAVTKGIEQPVLLLAPNQTGHDVQLKPHDLLQLKQANFVLWFGSAYEQGLAHLLKNQPNSIALFDLKAFKRLPLRNPQTQALPNTLDAHIWLDPVNASAIAHAIAAVRSQQFPAYAAQYRRNADQFSHQLLQAAFIAKKEARLKPYWAYHDAYQYLENSLNLQFKGSLTADHSLPPTLKQIQWLQQHKPAPQGATAAMCLLSESTIQPATLARLQPVNVQLIDETMRAHRNFIAAWTALAQQINHCH